MLMQWRRDSSLYAVILAGLQQMKLQLSAEILAALSQIGLAHTNLKNRNCGLQLRQRTRPSTTIQHDIVPPILHRIVESIPSEWASPAVVTDVRKLLALSIKSRSRCKSGFKRWVGSWLIKIIPWHRTKGRDLDECKS